jgi:hypothetical protein
MALIDVDDFFPEEPEPLSLIPFEWEKLDGSNQRAKVYGGWIVIHFEDVFVNIPGQGMVCGWEWKSAMVFIPDSKHEWKITKQEN